LTPEQLELQRLGMKKVVSQSDIVITTAQVRVAAPRIVTRDMVEAMKPAASSSTWPWSLAATSKARW
jgi:NAD(P) transhydrogenase subunit alpha